MDEVEFEDVSLKYGNFAAVDNVSFSIKSGEFFSMLGPSGSGKTTCLRLIAGFANPSHGKILILGKDQTGVPPYRRNVNTVFQDYALFPHLSIMENIGYGLKLKNFSKEEIYSKSREMLETVRLPNIENRKPSELSGGQRQRIALARALVNKPSVLLLDEPLGALDLKLREEMQIELKHIQRKVGITFVFVTHDQEEALSMSDRVAVFNKGKIVQIGSPKEIYEKPKNEFVANFVGISNLFHEAESEKYFNQKGKFLIRPEKLFLHSTNSKTGSERFSIKVKLINQIYSGATSRIILETELGTKLITLRQNIAVTEAELDSHKEFLLEGKFDSIHKIEE